MLRTETLVENIDRELELSTTDARAIQELGRRLRSDRSWWGATTLEENELTERSVIRCTRVREGVWRIRVVDAVGVVATNDLQLVVEPKIPLPHLTYLLEASGSVPRLADDERAQIAEDRSFWRLVARWYTLRLEELLRRGLIRDYRDTIDELQLVRGRVDIMPTTRNFYQGRMALLCEYQEYDEDNVLNRLLLAAARTVAASPDLEWPLRRRARQLSMRLDGVGELRSEDVHVTLDLRTSYYRDAIALARNIIVNRGRQLRSGEASAWTFLFRTPEPIEQGIRAVLSQRLAPDHVVTKKGRPLPPSSKTLNPDLVFDHGAAVADVKYKLTTADWIRSDLYQAVAFAAGYRTTKTAIVTFGEPASRLQSLPVGDILVEHLIWPTNLQNADDAADQLAAQTENWLRSTRA